MLPMRFQHTSRLCVVHDELQTPSAYFLLEAHPVQLSTPEGTHRWDQFGYRKLLYVKAIF